MEGINGPEGAVEGGHRPDGAKEDGHGPIGAVEKIREINKQQSCPKVCLRLYKLLDKYSQLV